MSHLITKTTGHVLIIEFASDAILDTSVAEQVGAELSSIANRYQGNKILIDFANVPLVTSSMIGQLIKFQQTCSEQKQLLFLCNLSADLTDVFKKLKLQKTFHLYKNRDKAMSAFAKK